MSVTERMQALGDHAKSSRQSPLRPRQTANGDVTAASNAFIHDNPSTPPAFDEDAVKALLHDTVEDRSIEELIIPESATVPIIAESHAGELIPNEAGTASKQPVVRESDDHFAARPRSSTNGKTGQPCTRMSWKTPKRENTSLSICKRRNSTS